MNTPFVRRAFVSATVGSLLAAGASWAVPVVFTNDTTIATNNLSYEGTDIVVRACTVTIQGCASQLRRSEALPAASAGD
jgi:hypothetical protein